MLVPDRNWKLLLYSDEWSLWVRINPRSKHPYRICGVSPNGTPESPRDFVDGNYASLVEAVTDGLGVKIDPMIAARLNDAEVTVNRHYQKVAKIAGDMYMAVDNMRDFLATLLYRKVLR